MSRPSVSTAPTVTPGTRLASRMLPTGTTACRMPARAAACTIGSTPRTGRTLPSSPSSPTTTAPSTAPGGTRPSPASTASAMARSKQDPCFGSAAGRRFTVIRRIGHRSPELTIAARTRSRASESAASGSPDSTRVGSPLARSASTSTRCPASPTSAMQSVFAYPIRTRP